jgi:hypothetical protein
MLAAKNKSTLDEMGNYDDALGIIENRIWNAVVGSFLNAVENFCRGLEPLDGIFTSGCCPDICCGENQGASGDH